MAEGLQKLVENLQAEINNLQRQVSSGRLTVPKDLSLISLIPRWSGTKSQLVWKSFLNLWSRQPEQAAGVNLIEYRLQF